MAASPNSLASRVRGAPGLMGSVTVTALTAPSAKPLADKLVAGPQLPVALLPTQRRSPMDGLPPPFVKSYVTNMSPAVRVGTAEAGGSFAHAVDDWLNSKSMFAFPRTFVRSHAR